MSDPMTALVVHVFSTNACHKVLLVQAVSANDAHSMPPVLIVNENWDVFIATDLS